MYNQKINVGSAGEGGPEASPNFEEVTKRAAA
jgi:hypothetical protein